MNEIHDAHITARLNRPNTFENSRALEYKIPAICNCDAEVSNKAERVHTQAEYDARPMKEFTWRHRRNNEIIKSWGRTDLAAMRNMFQFCESTDRDYRGSWMRIKLTIDNIEQENTPFYL